MEIQTIQDRVSNLRCCIIVPTYNNEKTLRRVIDGILVYTSHIIIVNDGATDSTATILKEYPNLEQIHFFKNKGKGQALRHGFKHALSLGYQHAITIDSDGQHFPEDLVIFIDALEKTTTPDVLLIGARNMNQDSVPKKSSFGNKFSNFWFKVETGIQLQDTQSGFRLYPLVPLSTISFFTTKFEFEIEVIVKAAWKGIQVKNIPVKVLYDATERVSHFKPWKDFTRISILNTWLVLLTFLYIKPKQFFQKFKKKGFKKFLYEDLLGDQDSPRKKGLSIALGVFIGLSPFWGFHTIIVLFLAAALNLNKAIAFAFSNVSLPPFIPYVILISYKVGAFVMNQDIGSYEELDVGLEVAKSLKLYIIGSFVFASIASITFGFLGYLVAHISQRKKVEFSQ